jgi:phosphoribosylglycinamide formyltransferase-1
MHSENRWSVVVLASGRGTNLQALHQASLNDGLPIEIAGVFSDKANSGAIEYARQHNLHQQSLAAKDFSDRATFDTALMQAVASVNPKLIVCAGYMRIISPEGIAHAPCPMINIHPSLLPLYPGLNTHARALADGQLQHGASVHLVDDILDGGRILSQVRVPVLANDNLTSLTERVLNREHPLLIETVRAICQNRIPLQSVQQAQVLCLQDDNKTLD